MAQASVDAKITTLSARLKACEAARAQAEAMNALLRSAIGQMTDGVTICEANGDVIMFNAASIRLNEVPPDLAKRLRNGNMRDAFAWQWEAGHAIPGRKE